MKSSLSNKKIPCIPLMHYQNRYINKYKDKTELINNFFTNRCSGKMCGNSIYKMSVNFSILH